MTEFLARFRLLPLLVLVTIAAFAVRVGDTMMGMRDVANLAMAEEGVLFEPGQMEGAGDFAGIAPAAGDAPVDVRAKDDAATLKLPEDAPAADGMAADRARPNISLPDATLPEVWGDPSQQAMADSPEQMRLLEDLAARREKLDLRERALTNREALLKATEKQLDDKLREMASLRDQIEKLLGQQEAAETEKIQSLVKIYEGMKAKEAAAIFNQMEMDVLLQVVSNMSERKSAPIIAKMDTTKANELTLRMTEMRKLPTAGRGMRGVGPVPTSAPPGSAPLPGLDALGAP